MTTSPARNVSSPAHTYAQCSEAAATATALNLIGGFTEDPSRSL